MKSFKELRTDPHRPSAMDPAEYVFVGAADDHPGDSYMEIRHDILARHGVETGSSDRQSFTNVPFYDAREDGRPNYRCHHCGKHGSNIRYFCFFLHKPSQQVIVVGQICAKKLSLGSRNELDFQKRADDFRRMQARHAWVNNHPEEVAFLREYDEQHSNGGIYVEFFESLWEKLQQYASLTDGQLAGLQKWMARGKPWERPCPECGHTEDHKMQCSQCEGKGLIAPAKGIDGDRHQAEVTRHQEPPTEAQVNYINNLADQLQRIVTIPETRIEASNLINALKAELQTKLECQIPIEVLATSPQISFINGLMDERKLPIEDRRKARKMLDEGLTKSQASRWIERLQELPRIES